MRKLIMAACALMAAGTALAGDVVPKEGTPEYTIRASLQLFRDNKVDDFIAKWCDPSKCQPEKIESLKAYDFMSASKQAHNCLHGNDDAIQVTRTEGDASKDSQVKIWVQCEAQRLPVPTSLKKSADGKWLVSQLSF